MSKPKKLYRVAVREVHTQAYSVRAESAQDAIERIADGEGELIDGALSYLHMVDPEGCKACGIDPWNVRVKKEKKS